MQNSQIPENSKLMKNSEQIIFNIIVKFNFLGRDSKLKNV